MSSRHDRFQDLCSAWLLGALEEEELREFEGLLKQADPEMLRTCSELEHAALHLPATVPLEDPPPRVKERLMKAARSTSREPRQDWITNVTAWLGLNRPRTALAVTGILFALLVGLGFATLLLLRAFEQAEERIAVLAERLERGDQVLEILQSKEVEVVLLNGLDASPQGYGKLIWDTENSVAVLQITNLPPVPVDRRYQLWVYAEDRDPTSAGVFALNDPQQEAFFRFENFTSVEKQAINGFLVTLEPEGGASEPGEEWYLGAYVSF